MKTKHLGFLSLVFASTLSLSVAQEKKESDADNTERNKRDQPGKTETPMDQSNDPADIKLVATIRQLVVKDDTLSSTAKNCKIITSGGRVVLRGPVNTSEEKAAIESHATKSAGEGKVDSRLEVKKGS
ncbi:BON domain-containing protein [Roseimicrobium sp. ORNL1]|uniref:BON domain-containing protein n=1 Tax=Roseimicrobium sp. ORNL1 TaxID=2711231 RepID=UPI0013E11B39|nr:BON domain-containing protein [Roseimicrobium sp. ORNL1]QIF02865.1 BON domain-containing protein [Roseimicrobium sp. ORNL1]